MVLPETWESGTWANSLHFFEFPLYPLYSASLTAQLVKNPPAVREMWIQSLGWKDPLEKGKAAHSSIVA